MSPLTRNPTPSPEALHGCSTPGVSCCRACQPTLRNLRLIVSVTHEQQQLTRGDNNTKVGNYYDGWYCTTLDGNTINL